MFYFCDWFSLLSLANPARTDKTLAGVQVSCHFWQGCSMQLRNPTSPFSQAKIPCSNLVPRVLSYPSLLSERETTGWKENLETRLTLFPFCTVLWVVRQVLFIISNVLHLYFLTIHKDILCKNRSEESLDYFHAGKSRKCSYKRVRRTCDCASCGTKDWEKGMRCKLLDKKNIDKKSKQTQTREEVDRRSKIVFILFFFFAMLYLSCENNFILYENKKYIYFHTSLSPPWHSCPVHLFIE